MLRCLRRSGESALKRRAAVESVYAGYREVVERQHRAAQLSRDLHTPTPRPEGGLRFTNTRVEFVLRCPVPIGRMTEAADRLTRTLVLAMEKEPRLKFGIASAPKIHTAMSARGAD